jgi:hypothetical protein
MRYVILMGNPGDGFRVIGPFDHIEDARIYLEGEFSKQDCWIMELDAPDEEFIARTVMERGAA